MIAGPDVRSAVHLVPPVLQNIGVGIAVRVEIENLVVLLAAAARPASGRPGPVDDNVARAAQPAAALQGFLIIRLQPVDRFAYRAVFDVIAVPVDHNVRFAVVTPFSSSVDGVGHASATAPASAESSRKISLRIFDSP